MTSVVASHLDPQAAVVAAREQLAQGIDRLNSEVRLEGAYRMEKTAWKALSLLSALIAVAAVRKALGAGWRKARAAEPPTDAGDPDVALSDALLWTTATALGMGLAKVALQRGAAKGWQKATGRRPPGLDFAERPKK